MKNFFEGLKDVLYDGIDYIMMVVVIVVVVLVINWRLGGLFAKDATDDTIFTKTPTTIDSDNTTSNGGEDQPENIDSNENQENNLNENEDKGTNEDDTKTVVKITIPPGSLPAKIGDILVANELIDDKNQFVEKAVELKVETKLKSGEFEIAKNSSLEEILKILTK
ncbi:endolytic transglycosylase MltG [Clostridium sp. Cult2]|uniref:endolytic transglycosylase MltG n=1 Tax=Clostridium sp. Cult2 TaxID=2079003 RepID=UPI001F382CA9|nr:endolytic transglycosylase MltG [Clostridium sp. Cult2]MCF6465762.1 hypothetical protein [Clostridium sp. Cult2]